MNFGFSTACAFTLSYPECSELLLPGSLGCFEISALRYSEFSTAIRFLESLAPSCNISFHLPDKDLPEDYQIPLSHVSEKINKYIVHPHTFLKSPQTYEPILSKLCIENLDSRPIAASFTHLGKLFNEMLRDLPDLRICLDLAHLLSVSKSPSDSLDFVHQYFHRISEIHLSFFNDYGKHCQMSESHLWFEPASELLSMFRATDVDVILETPLSTSIQVAEQLRLAQEMSKIS